MQTPSVEGNKPVPAGVERTRIWLLSILVGVGCAALGGALGIVLFGITIALNWFDGPGGGLIIFPLVLICGSISGLLGWRYSLRTLSRVAMK